MPQMAEYAYKMVTIVFHADASFSRVFDRTRKEIKKSGLYFSN
jgi:hypothetical protein